MSFASAEENLACDEALLELGESGYPDSILRFWEAGAYFVVMGYANKKETEVRVENCRWKKIPIFRRVSGGGTVLQGPGCLNYSLILPNQSTSGVRSANRFVLHRHRDALSQALRKKITVRGHTDLCLRERKFSGNSQRRKRRTFLFHGTFLYDFDLSKIEDALHPPTIEPTYRKKRGHLDFLMNLEVKPSLLKEILMNTWDADSPLDEVPFEKIKTLAKEITQRL